MWQRDIPASFCITTLPPHRATQHDYDPPVDRGQITQIQIAKWSPAHGLRSLERYKEALQIQRVLEAAHAEAGTDDGTIFDEITENLTAKKDTQASKLYYYKANEVLSNAAWFVRNEAGRLQ